MDQPEGIHMARPRKQPVVMPQEGDTVGVSIISMKSGDGVRYACGGFHLAPEDAALLPEGKNKIEPGDVVQLPREAADKYRHIEVLRFS